MSEVSSTGAFSTVTVVAVWVSRRSWTGSAGAEAQPVNAVTIMAARADTPAQELARIMMRSPDSCCYGSVTPRPWCSSSRITRRTQSERERTEAGHGAHLGDRKSNSRYPETVPASFGCDGVTDDLRARGNRAYNAAIASK